MHIRSQHRREQKLQKQTKISFIYGQSGKPQKPRWLATRFSRLVSRLHSPVGEKLNNRSVVALAKLYERKEKVTIDQRQGSGEFNELLVSEREIVWMDEHDGWKKKTKNQKKSNNSLGCKIQPIPGQSVTQSRRQFHVGVL